VLQGGGAGGGGLLDPTVPRVPQHGKQWGGGKGGEGGKGGAGASRKLEAQGGVSKKGGKRGILNYKQPTDKHL